MTAPKVYVPAPGRPPEWVVDLMVSDPPRLVRTLMGWSVAVPCPWGMKGDLMWVDIDDDEAIRLNEDGSLEIIDAPCEHEWHEKQRDTFANGAGSATRRILRCEKCGQEKYEVTKDEPCEHDWRPTDVLRCAKCGEECRADAILDASKEEPEAAPLDAHIHRLCHAIGQFAAFDNYMRGGEHGRLWAFMRNKAKEAVDEATKAAFMRPSFKAAPEPTFTKSEVVEALVEEARKSDSIYTGVSGRVAAERIAEVLGILSEYRKERCK